MRKICWILALLLVFSCLCVTVQAAESPSLGTNTVTVSEDFRTVSWNGKEYQRFQTTGTKLTSDAASFEVTLTEEQQETLKAISVIRYNESAVLRLEISFLDGGKLTAHYLRTDLLDDHAVALAGKADNCFVDFEWPTGNIVQAKKSLLTGQSMTLKANILEWCESYEVRFRVGDSSLEVVGGAVLCSEERYYYVDFLANGIEYGESGFSAYEYFQLEGWEITDEDLLAQLRSASEAYYNDGLGFLSNDTLSQAIAKVFTVLLFCVLPFGLFVLFLVLSLRAKQPVYRVMFRVVWVLSVVLMTVAAVCMILLW